MKINQIKIHNFRSVIDADIEAHDFLLLVGSNNAGKSNIINALRCFYEDLKWIEEDFPKKGFSDQVSWVELKFKLSSSEWETIADKYKLGNTQNEITLRRYFRGDKAKPKQSNIYAIVNGVEEEDYFYGAKNIGTAKCGSIVYIPALTTPAEQMKTTGPSPLRNMLNFMIKKVVSKSDKYKQLGKAFEDLNKEANQDSGFLSEIASPINQALNQWNVKIDLSVNPISPEEISKSLVKYAFVDMILGDSAFELDRFGHGFQRSVIYELIRISPKFQDEKEAKKKEFNPDFSLILFEEPEAFLHPAQQENMAYHLRRLGQESEHQVIITSHSPIFVGKSSDAMGQICKVQKESGVSYTYQLKSNQMESLLKSGGDFLLALKSYVQDPQLDQVKKSKAEALINSAPSQEISSQHEKFRFQMWLDSDRSSMFFADKVILVEGATEKALFNYLLANQWHDLTVERIAVVDALGKFNFHRFMNLFKVYGIRHGIMFDNDNEKNEHAAVNQFIRDKKNSFTLADPFEFTNCLEKHMGLELPGRDDQKPLHILQKLEDGSIPSGKLDALKMSFKQALGI